MNFTTSKKTIVISFISLSLGIFLSFIAKKDNFNYQKSINAINSKLDPIERFSISQKNKHKSSNQSSENLGSFFKKLQNCKNSNEYEELLQNLLSIENDSNAFNDKMELLLAKWGSSSPKRALEKIVEYGGSKSWFIPVFRGWAKVNPEAAASFLINETDNSFIKNNPYVLIGISQEWALHDPVKALDWIMAQKNKNIYGEDYQSCKNLIIEEYLNRFPEKFQDLITLYSNNELELNAYDLGKNLGKNSFNFSEYVDKIPKEIKIKLEAGKIMGITKGDLGDIKKRVSSLNKIQQNELIKELSIPIIMSSRLDIKDRVDWILDFLPEISSSSELDYHIKNWILEDKEAKQWINDIPPGSKKEYLLNLTQINSY